MTKKENIQSSEEFLCQVSNQLDAIENKIDELIKKRQNLKSPIKRFMKLFTISNRTNPKQEENYMLL